MRCVLPGYFPTYFSTRTFVGITSNCTFRRDYYCFDYSLAFLLSPSRLVAQLSDFIGGQILPYFTFRLSTSDTLAPITVIRGGVWYLLTIGCFNIHLTTAHTHQRRVQLIPLITDMLRSTIIYCLYYNIFIKNNQLIFNYF